MQKAPKSIFEAKKISDLRRRLGVMREHLEVYILTQVLVFEIVGVWQ
jgi:hypothetical protein